MPRSRALAYAEDVLGVHKVYQDVLNNRDRLDETLTELAKVRDQRRDLENLVSDAEMDVITEQRGKHPDMAVTRWDKHIKEAFQQNDVLRTLREQLTKISAEIEGLEFDRSIIETDIKIGIGRMHELGGYFQYLAETKRAALNPTTPEKQQ